MNNFVIRKLEKFDYLEYFDVLMQLSNTLLYNKQLFDTFFDNLPNNIHIFVVCDNMLNKVIGCGTVIIETKIIHNFGKVGHIEDIVIDKNYRNHGLGKFIVSFLINFAKTHNCYKIILTSDDKNVKFYEKNKFIKKDNMMALYF